MKTIEFDKLPQFAVTFPNITPVNLEAYKIVESKGEGEILYLQEVSGRDIKFHRAYFGLVNYIHSYLPKPFQMKIPKDKFYRWLKHLQGDYDVIFEFKDGTKFVEYKSISFGRMNQRQFEEYVREQMPFIYENVIRVLYPDDRADAVIDNIESEFEKFLSKL